MTSNPLSESHRFIEDRFASLDRRDFNLTGPVSGLVDRHISVCPTQTHTARVVDHFTTYKIKRALT